MAGASVVAERVSVRENRSLTTSATRQFRLEGALLLVWRMVELETAALSLFLGIVARRSTETASVRLEIEEIRGFQRGAAAREVALTLRVRIAAKPKVLRAFRLAERDGYNRVRKKSQALRVRIAAPSRRHLPGAGTPSVRRLGVGRAAGR
jgi:hypothetical protein